MSKSASCRLLAYPNKRISLLGFVKEDGYSNLMIHVNDAIAMASKYPKKSKTCFGEYCTLIQILTVETV